MSYRSEQTIAGELELMRDLLQAIAEGRTADAAEVINRAIFLLLEELEQTRRKRPLEKLRASVKACSRN